jgi:hypothetical protein
VLKVGQGGKNGVLAKIEKYRKTKEANFLDAFYPADLDYMIKCIKYYEDNAVDKVAKAIDTEETIRSVLVGDSFFMVEHFLPPVQLKKKEEGVD